VVKLFIVVLCNNKLVKLEQPLKAVSPILVMVAGIVIPVNPVQPLNIETPNLLFNKETLVNPLQPSKTLLPILVMLAGIDILVNPVQPLNIEAPNVLFNKETLVNPLQPSKALLPILVMFEGMVIFFKPVQPLKAFVPILDIDEGNSIFVKLIQLLKVLESMLVIIEFLSKTIFDKIEETEFNADDDIDETVLGMSNKPYEFVKETFVILLFVIVKILSIDIGPSTHTLLRIEELKPAVVKTVFE
jgi:hypothetical protein